MKYNYTARCMCRTKKQYFFRTGTVESPLPIMSKNQMQLLAELQTDKENILIIDLIDWKVHNRRGK